MTTPTRRGDHGLGVTPGGGNAGSFAPRCREAATAPPTGAAVGTVEFTSYVSEIDGATVIELDSPPDAGRVRINLNDAPVYDDDPERPDALPPMPFGDLVQKSAEERVGAVKAALVQHLLQYPDDAYQLLDAVTSTVRDSHDAYPAVGLFPENQTDEGGWMPGRVINPRTGEEDTLIAVDSSVRRTELDSDSIGDGTITFDYDSTEDYDGVMYITSSDQLPVRLPEGWTE